MTLKAAILADDLTGALDTGTPFVENGLSVAVAVTCEGVEAALSQGPDVLVVNTASRALPAAEAAARVLSVAKYLKACRPSLVMKKIDSRLKGNVAAETLALADALGCHHIVVAPAIPDQQRFTRAGHVTGRGVDQAMSIPALFGQNPDPTPTPATVTVRDAESDSDLEQIVMSEDWSVSLAVGARGLGQALAKMIGQPGATLETFTASGRTLFAFGSRDPITSGQMSRLEQSGRLATVIDAPKGLMPESTALSLPALIRCTGAMDESAETVANRFAAGLRDAVFDSSFDMLMIGGGDTALAVLTAVGVDVLVPKGEIVPGIPWFEVKVPGGMCFRCAVKSGGFGTPDSLLAVLPETPGQDMTGSKETCIG